MFPGSSVETFLDYCHKSKSISNKFKMVDLVVNLQGFISQNVVLYFWQPKTNFVKLDIIFQTADSIFCGLLLHSCIFNPWNYQFWCPFCVYQCVVLFATFRVAYFTENRINSVVCPGLKLLLM